MLHIQKKFIKNIREKKIFLVWLTKNDFSFDRKCYSQGGTVNSPLWVFIIMTKIKDQATMVQKWHGTHKENHIKGEIPDVRTEPCV